MDVPLVVLFINHNLPLIEYDSVSYIYRLHVHI